jgi:hypothetical protein
MPHVIPLRSRRLLYFWGIYVLVVLAALLLTVFGSVTDRPITFQVMLRTLGIDMQKHCTLEHVAAREYPDHRRRVYRLFRYGRERVAVVEFASTSPASILCSAFNGLMESICN